MTQRKKGGTGALELLEPGVLSLIQDRGRIGSQRFGVSRSGVMDPHAAAWANRMLDNPVGSALIEVTLGGLRLRAREDTWLAFTGARMALHLDGRPLSGWSRFAIRAGQTLSVGFASSGQRGYLAVRGGFLVEPKLGSVATHARNRLGGLHGDGRPLARGDLLAHPPGGDAFRLGARAPWKMIPDYREVPLLRVLPGGDHRHFPAAQIERFFDQRWQVSASSDRMGIRLCHEQPLREVPSRKMSLGICPGAIQVPPNGEPIVLMSDCQTMGGYPLFGWLHPLDLGRLSQVPARQEVRFAPIDVETMQAELARFNDFFDHPPPQPY
ncbi:biotin-dependent carboxyltransferase family protein [Halotalea alkalilenta]|uniref:Allophanate hydrolase n=1 Tax=Halotalea alkalilenta TaxID=376489 RepID=A0A172YEW2_9GAMM|nr:biotin-dependent carboxyltransferase family protein [Halotalea alkalilenta]ANF57737.1 allophanate hydrolase [Halotalea alkalilenta]